MLRQEIFLGLCNFFHQDTPAFSMYYYYRVGLAPGKGAQMLERDLDNYQEMKEMVRCVQLHFRHQKQQLRSSAFHPVRFRAC
jgi:hypothetical protein